MVDRSVFTAPSPLLAVRRAVGRDVISACRAILERRLALGLAVREWDEWAHERDLLEGKPRRVVEWSDERVRLRWSLGVECCLTMCKVFEGTESVFWSGVDQRVDEDLDLAATLEDHLPALRAASVAASRAPVAVLGSSGRTS